jgi:hypothetical protein
MYLIYGKGVILLVDIYIDAFNTAVRFANPQSTLHSMRINSLKIRNLPCGGSTEH